MSLTQSAVTKIGVAAICWQATLTFGVTRLDHTPEITSPIFLLSQVALTALLLVGAWTLWSARRTHTSVSGFLAGTEGGSSDRAYNVTAIAALVAIAFLLAFGLHLVCAGCLMHFAS